MYKSIANMNYQFRVYRRKVISRDCYEIVHK